MRIASTFKDYYDFPSYGFNTDASLVYNRTFAPLEFRIDNQRFPDSDRYSNRIFTTSDYQNLYYIDEEDFADYVPEHLHAASTRDRPVLKRSYIFICDKCYRIYVPNFANLYEVYTHNKEDHYKPEKVYTSANGFEATVNKIAKGKGTYHWNKPVDIKPKLVENSPPANTESGYPILLMANGVYKNPCLMFLGFNAIEIDQIYQEIEMFLGRSKDLASPPMNDVAKVETHGFDKKVSFRKRTNEL